MAVAKESTWSEVDEHIETLCEIAYRLSKLGINLQKMGRANYSVRLLEEKLKFAKEQWKELCERYTAVRKLLRPAQRQVYEFFKQNCIVTAANDFHEYVDLVSTEIDRLTANTKPAVSDAQCSIPIELPKQRIPKFGGDPREWEHFEDLFTSGVINNAGLADVQRLHYLNACLEGPAAAIISTIEVVGRNFAEAWSRLKNEFGLPRIVTGKLLDKLLYMEPIDMSDLASMQQVTVNCAQALAALNKKGTPEQQRDWLLAHWVKQHFTPKMELEWQRTLDLSPEYPTFEDVRKFVDKQSRALLSMSEERRNAALGLPIKSARNRSAAWKTSSVSKNVRSHNVVMETNSAVEPQERSYNDDIQATLVPEEACGFCTGPHELLKCNNFLILSAKMRSKYVRNRRWCILCLGNNHTVTQCQSSEVCAKCSGRHHSLLHFELPRAAHNQKSLPNNEYDNREEWRSNASRRRVAKFRSRAKNSTSSTDVTHAST
ncbi:uncharacterized protein LOC122400579 [Colletes gigas]|uniref:uncharacterized protein LOC122400579 n=1 Tax=Colletes gigas TaxID=935657 RepID=UPI001C9AC8A7|nr:uncharacterized protein LOC122400579 [Colletes gigas]